MRRLVDHREQLLSCTRCPKMVGPVVAGPAVMSKVMLLGQAPGPHEGKVGRPFAWTAGRTLFHWLEGIGLDEERFRSRVYMAAVCRCFPGKSAGGGDRVPSRTEIENCSTWLESEVAILEPSLLIPVGKLAIAQVMRVDKLVDVVGSQQPVRFCGRDMDAIALPHPSGASTWHRMEPGKTLLVKALELLRRHPAMERIAATRSAAPPADRCGPPPGGDEAGGQRHGEKE